MEENKAVKHFPWLGLGFAFSTIAVIVLFGLFYYAVVRGSELSQQLARQVSHLQNRADDLEVHLDSLKKDSLETDDSLKQSIATLQQTLGSNPNTWRVMEAQFYVDLANTKLQFENNIPSAIELLKLADKTIQDLSDPALDGVRRALAQNTATLEAVPAIDVTGIYMRLSAINDQIDQLPLPIQVENNAITPVSTDANEPWWKKGLHESMTLLGKIVIVRYNTSNTPPLVTPSERDFLFQNVHAAIEKSMWALLHHQPDIYRASLQQAIKWINQFYMANAPVTQSVLTNLDQLEQMNIAPTIPDINASTQAFHDYFANGGKA